MRSYHCATTACLLLLVGSSCGGSPSTPSTLATSSTSTDPALVYARLSAWMVKNSLWDPARPADATERVGEFTITATCRGQVFIQGANGGVRVASLAAGESFVGWYDMVTFKDRKGLYRDVRGYRVPDTLGGSGEQVQPPLRVGWLAVNGSYTSYDLDAAASQVELRATRGATDPLAAPAFRGELAVGMTEDLARWAWGRSWGLGGMSGVSGHSDYAMLRGPHRGTFLRFLDGVLSDMDRPLPTGR